MFIYKLKSSLKIYYLNLIDEFFFGIIKYPKDVSDKFSRTMSKGIVV